MPRARALSSLLNSLEEKIMNSYAEKIAVGQKKDGSFADSDSIESVFFTSLILGCLNRCGEAPEIKIIRQKSADFLFSQKNKDWIFSKSVNINFCALSALAGYNKGVINAEAVAKILKKLIQIESKEGGPYYSYFDSNGKITDKNIDLAANSVIAGFLYSLEVELPNLNDLVEAAIGNSNFTADFYVSDYPVIYSISQFYKGDKKNKLIELILAKKDRDKHWGNPLNSAMSMSSLFNLGCSVEKIGSELDHLKNLDEEELSKPYPLKKNEFSTAELNFAFYLEAMSKFGKENNYKNIGGHSGSHEEILDKAEEKMFKSILKLAEERFSVISPAIKGIAFEEIKKTIKGNHDKQMSLMPFWFKEALGKRAEKISDDSVARLGLMNIFFWTAFIIYDDFWDEEGIPKILPIANLFTRDFIGFFRGLFPGDSEFNLFFLRLMDDLDSGNTEILINFRSKAEGGRIKIPEVIPDYGDYRIVYEPSSAHILGPVAIFYELGYGLNTEEVRDLIGYFKNYLIAMQINDDIYDWEEDLRRGHLSTVAVMLLNDLERKGGQIDITRDIDELKKVFWLKTLPKACKIVIEHTERSRQSLKRISILENPAPLDNLIDMIENAARTALEEQKYTSDFLKAYQG